MIKEEDLKVSSKKKNVHIGKNVHLGPSAKIDPQVYIGDNVTIGENSTIQYGTFIESNCKIGKHTLIGRNSVLRKGTTIGDYSVFGSLSASEGYNWIGNHVLVHSQCHLTVGLIIEDWSFIAPMFVGANDPDMVHGRRHIKQFKPQAPHIKFGSRIAINVSVLPNITIGREAIIGVGAVVTRDIPDFTIAIGVPARIKGKVPEQWHLPEEHYHSFIERVNMADVKERLYREIRIRE